MSLFQKKEGKQQIAPDSHQGGVPGPRSASNPQGAMQPLVQRPRVQRLLSYQVANLQEVGARKRQEDSFAFVNAFDVTEIKEKGLLFLVCDGMGGMKDGKTASETAVASLRRSFADMDRNADLARQLKESVFLAADEVEKRLGGDGGSTVVAGILFREKLYYASVGDSFLYLKRGNQLYRLNREHNLCCQTYLESIRTGEMDPRVGRECEEAAALTQFLGMTGFHDVDGSVRPLPMKDGDVLLACSDGVGGVLTEEETLGALSLHSAQAMCQQMNQGILAHAKKNQDNYTALVIKCLY
ncbi:MAG: serine/threonine-protein phosphatase [Clostridium sp.]|nr:serine/threonine-protein phosphatase [Clostridium sp.]